jgi:hypothetical protein
MTALREINAQMSDLAFFKKLPNDCNDFSRKEFEANLQKNKKSKNIK